MKLGAIFSAGLLLGITLIIACGSAGRRAGASPADCAAWIYSSALPAENVTVDYTGANGVAQSIAAYESVGWEPFGVGFTGSVYFRRCKP
jgi:hypothetical protein